MKYTIIAMTLLFGGLLAHATDNPWAIPADKEKFHIFLLMGQSNMAGGISDTKFPLSAADKTPVPHIVMIPTPQEKNFSWKPAAHPLHIRKKRPKSFGLGLPFAKKYQEQHPDVTVGLIPVAFGGHSIDKLNKGTKVYENAMMKAAFAAQKGVIKGILWHQGESDTNKGRAASYEEKLHQLVADVRQDLGIADLPFIVGDLGELYGVGKGLDPDPEKVASIKIVRAALSMLPEKVPYTGFVKTDGLDYCDAPKCTHFDRASYIILGHRYCDAYEQVRNKK